MNTRKYWKMLAVCLVVMLLASFVSALVKTGAGSILVRETRINTRGGTLSGVMYIPKSALENDGHGNYTSLRPAVVLSHGYLNSNQMQDPNAIELSRRGFVVFSMDMYGHGNSDLPNATDDPTGTGATLGAIDAYEYMLTLPYVDHTRIGLAAHSMGGMNTGNAVALEAGFFTLEDALLEMLYSELGAEVTAEDVAAQDPDAVAARLSEKEQGIYEVRKQEITDEYAVRPFAELFIGSGPGFAALTQSHEVEVAGVTVWRDLQANVGVNIGLIEENAWLMFGANADGIDNASQIPETALACQLFGTGENTVERLTWYSLNLSDTTTQAQSDMLGGFNELDASDEALRQAIANRSARVINQPYEIHAGNHFSLNTTSFVVQFFSTVMNYNNGELADGAVALDPGNAIWPVKEIANGVALAALFVMVWPLFMILLNAPFFASLQATPAEPMLSRHDKGFWGMNVLLVLIPAATLIPFFMLGGAPTTYAGNKGPIAWSALFSQEMSTRLMVWAVLNGLIALALLVVRHLCLKKDGLSFVSRYSLAIKPKALGKTAVLALCVFACTYLSVVVCSFFFDLSDARLWVIAGRVMTAEQFRTWAGYLVFFLVFYLVNSMVVNSGRMKDMSEGKNLALCAVINGLGLLLMEAANYIYLMARGHLVWYDFGQDFFLTLVVAYPLVVVLPLAAVYARKMYLRTGSVWPGALLNTMLFTWLSVGNTCYHYSMIL